MMPTALLLSLFHQERAGVRDFARYDLHLSPRPSPGGKADKDRYFMRITLEQLPSPLMGEGSGGGEDSTSSPHPHLPPPRGEGVLTYPCQPKEG
jgi:hypothetical protein